MSVDRTAEIKRLDSEKLSNGPFIAQPTDGEGDSWRIADGNGNPVALMLWEDDARFIACAANNALTIIDKKNAEIAELQAKLRLARIPTVRHSDQAWRDKTAALEQHIAALQAERDRYKQYFDDTTSPASDWPCLPSCDTFTHAEGCPHINPAYAFRKMLEQIAEVRAANRELRDINIAGTSAKIGELATLRAKVAQLQAENEGLLKTHSEIMEHSASKIERLQAERVQLKAELAKAKEMNAALTIVRDNANDCLTMRVERIGELERENESLRDELNSKRRAL
jgi:DNA repair exonuclease SbcCD ATPase subunit